MKNYRLLYETKRFYSASGKTRMPLLKREGSKHSLWCNPANGKAATVPRHNELKDFLCIQICKQLDIPRP